MADERDEDDYPMGLRFKPRPYELIYYLRMKVKGQCLPCNMIKDLSYYKYTPLELQNLCGMKRVSKCYFFMLREKRYRNGKRPRRVCDYDGCCWKPMDSDEIVRDEDGKDLKGVRRTLKYFQGDRKTDWMIKEYKLNDPELNINLVTTENPMRLDWVVCKLNKSKRGKKRMTEVVGDDGNEEVQMEKEGASSNIGENFPDPLNYVAPPPYGLGVHGNELELLLDKDSTLCVFDGLFIDDNFAASAVDGSINQAAEETPAQMEFQHSVTMTQLPNSSSQSHAQRGLQYGPTMTHFPGTSSEINPYDVGLNYSSTMTHFPSTSFQIHPHEVGLKSSPTMTHFPSTSFQFLAQMSNGSSQVYTDEMRLRHGAIMTQYPGCSSQIHAQTMLQQGVMMNRDCYELMQMHAWREIVQGHDQTMTQGLNMPSFDPAGCNNPQQDATIPHAYSVTTNNPIAARALRSSAPIKLEGNKSFFNNGGPPNQSR